MRDIDTEKPSVALAKYNAASYRRLETNHGAQDYIDTNDMYNNHARCINRERCRGLQAFGWRYPPNGLIRIVDPYTGRACPVAPSRMQKFIDVTISLPDCQQISDFYGLGWRLNFPGHPMAAPLTSAQEMAEDYAALLGA